MTQHDNDATIGARSARARLVIGHSRRTRRGVGLVELLIALSISAALLTAVGAATHASFKAYAINAEQASLMQNARLATNRIVTYIRRYKEHQPLTAAKITNFSTGQIVTDTGISMLNDDGAQIDFSYDAVNKRVLVKEGGKTHVLLHGVTAFQVTLEPMKSSASIKAGGSFDLLRRASVLVSVKTSGNSADMNESTDSQTVTLSASIMPRRNAW